jgi:predicted nucleic acid-binding Zn ribbon protein
MSELSVKSPAPHHPLKLRGIIADNLSEAGWSWGCSSEVDSTRRVRYTADAILGSHSPLTHRIDPWFPPHSGADPNIDEYHRILSFSTALMQPRRTVMATSHCFLCRKEIPRGAKICTECNSYQDWRKHFGFSSTVLSLLVALVSVLTVAVPVIRNALTPDRSEVHCALLTWNATGATLLVSNRGVRPAVVKSLRLKLVTSTQPKTETIFAGDFPEPPILEPGKFRTVKFYRISGSVRADLDPLVNFQSNYVLVLEIFPFASESSVIYCQNWKEFRE